jgi:hypothetical protein
MQHFSKNPKVENIFHRFVNVPFEPEINVSELPDYDPEVYYYKKFSTCNNPDLYRSDLCRWFAELGIAVPEYNIFYTPPFGGRLPIHIDQVHVKLNWSYGAPGSKQIWWEPKDEKYVLEIKSEYEDLRGLKLEHASKLFEVEITKPSLVHVSMFHSTYNPSEEERWTISIPLFHPVSPTQWYPNGLKALTWNEAIDLFEEYIDEEQ